MCGGGSCQSEEHVAMFTGRPAGRCGGTGVVFVAIPCTLLFSTTDTLSLSLTLQWGCLSPQLTLSLSLSTCSGGCLSPQLTLSLSLSTCSGGCLSPQLTLSLSLSLNLQWGVFVSTTDTLSLSLTLQWGVFVSCVEWTVFVCTHTLGHQWKVAFGAAPQWVKTVMDNG